MSVHVVYRVSRHALRFRLQISNVIYACTVARQRMHFQCLHCSASGGRQGGAVLVSAPATPNALPVVAPDAHGLGLVARQPGGAPALRPGDGRVTGLSYSGGLLWAGPVPSCRCTGAPSV